ncbi:hypothetical protein VPH35_048657 [Triticum aestivum]|uniref:Uncharacterized protein n=1 Tax=Triticum aestivum TaxID=4565 RepID=A0A077RTR2_WHEAT|nr:unnamed protein product [Triticum aestivum]
MERPTSYHARSAALLLALLLCCSLVCSAAAAPGGRPVSAPPAPVAQVTTWKKHASELTVDKEWTFTSEPGADLGIGHDPGPGLLQCRYRAQKTTVTKCCSPACYPSMLCLGVLGHGTPGKVLDCILLLLPFAVIANKHDYHIHYLGRNMGSTSLRTRTSTYKVAAEGERREQRNEARRAAYATSHVGLTRSAPTRTSRWPGLIIGQGPLGRRMPTPSSGSGLSLQIVGR